MGLVATALTFVSFAPYILGILRGHIKPHYFSFIIWGFATLVIFSGQIADGGGAGAWSIGLSGVLTLFVALLAFVKRDQHLITHSDKIFLAIALFSLPLWYVMNDPLWSVLLLVTIDVIGMAPTFRKAYHKPNEEQCLFFALITLRNIISIFALEHYSITTLAFPVATSAACIALIAMVLSRRKAL